MSLSRPMRAKTIKAVCSFFIILPVNVVKVRGEPNELLGAGGLSHQLRLQNTTSYLGGIQSNTLCL
jgi:hypothetical protein